MKKPRAAGAKFLVVASCATLSACGGGAAREALARGTCPTAADGSPLVLPGGLQAYVEPVSLLRVGSSTVVVGTPTYTWDVTGPQARQVTSREHVAAYLDEDAPRMVGKPLERPIGITRAVALDEHRWGVLFSEAEKIDSTATAVGFVGLWYAEYDGQGWLEPERLPMPEDPDVDLVIHSSSSLVPFDGGLSWAVTDLDRGTFRYERARGIWRVERAEPRGGEAASLAATENGLWLAVSGLDPAIAEPRKSIRVFRWHGEWELEQRYPTVQTYTEIRRPSLVASAGGVALTWVETPPTGDDDVRAAVGIAPGDEGRALVVDPGGQRVQPIALPGGDPAWVVLHPPELRVIGLEAGRARSLRSVPYPYTGWFAAVPIDSHEILVTGPEFNPDPAHASVRSLTLRLSLSCS